MEPGISGDSLGEMETLGSIRGRIVSPVYRCTQKLSVVIILKYSIILPHA
jgi:hypothetical protein